MRLHPIPQWLRQYRRQDLGADVSAGLTTAVLLVPQAMAYAMLAGLPPVHGLYASIAPLVLYALSGSSRVLAVGPVALLALLSGAAISDLAEPGSEAFIQYSILLAGMVGVLQLVMAAARLGYLLNFLSHPVIVGFTAAAAILIGVSQVPALLGWVEVGGSPEAIWAALSEGREISLAALATGLGSLAALLLLRRFGGKLPGPLIVVALASVVIWLLGSTEGIGVEIVGDVPSAPPVPSFSLPSIADLQALFPAAIAIALVGFLESVSVARAFHRSEDGPMRGDRELLALGLANVASAVFRGFSVAGGFSRTAVNARAGAQTQLAALISASFVLLSLLLLGPVLAHVPRAALAALILMAVASLIDIRAMRHIWTVKRTDFALLGLTFLATLILGVEEGILLGAVASLVVLVIHTTRPHYAVLGRIPRSGVWRNVKNHPEAEQLRGALFLRFDARLYFANTTFLIDRIRHERTACELPANALVLDMAGVNQLDSTAAEALLEQAKQLEEEGVLLLLAQVKEPCRRVLEAAGVLRAIGEEHVFLTLDEAAQWLERQGIASLGDGDAERPDPTGAPLEPANRQDSDPSPRDADRK